MKKINIIIWFLAFGCLQAQHSIITTGGNATGTSGTTNYTVGQFAYTTNTGADGSIAQGVQQAFEITEVLSHFETLVNLDINLYPNPTTNFLILKTTDSKNLSYQLYDLLGRIIKTNIIDSNNIIIPMKNLASATYILKITKNNNIIKIFKIVKN